MSRSQNDDLYELRQRYDIKETIGSGGFGKVKRAIHLPTGETVAIKVWNNAASKIAISISISILSFR